MPRPTPVQSAELSDRRTRTSYVTSAIGHAPYDVVAYSSAAERAEVSQGPKRAAHQRSARCTGPGLPPGWPSTTWLNADVELGATH